MSKKINPGKKKRKEKNPKSSFFYLGIVSFFILGGVVFLIIYLIFLDQSGVNVIADDGRILIDPLWMAFINVGALCFLCLIMGVLISKGLNATSE